MAVLALAMQLQLVVEVRVGRGGLVVGGTQRHCFFAGQVDFFLFVVLSGGYLLLRLDFQIRAAVTDDFKDAQFVPRHLKELAALQSSALVYKKWTYLHV